MGQRKVKEVMQRSDEVEVALVQSQESVRILTGWV